jgi:hypothetical protein
LLVGSLGEGGERDAARVQVGQVADLAVAERTSRALVLRASSRACGNAPLSRFPEASLVEGPPKCSQLASVSCTSSVEPSSDTRCRPRQNAPAVAGSATSPAAFSNSSRSGPAPSRERALLSARI